MQKEKAKTSFASIVKNISFVIGYSYNNCKMRVISIYIIALFSGINAANVALFYKYAIESFGHDNPLLFLLITISIYLLLHLFNTIIGSIFINVKFPIWDLKIKNGISKTLYDKYISIDLSDINNSEFYNKYIRALNEADQRSVQVLNILQYFLSNLFSALGILSVIAILNPVLIIFSILPVISSFFINMKITKERYHYEMSLTQENRKIDYIKRIFSLPQFREEIRTHDYNELLFNKYSYSNDEIINTIKTKMPSIINKSVFGANLFSLINYGVPAVYLGWQVLNKLISIGDFSTLLIGTANLSSSIFYMVTLAPQMAQHSLFINNLREILDYKSSMQSTDESKTIQKNKSHSIVLNNVSFKYNSSADDILKNISLRINKGEKIALVGENGAGKSTLVKLILRLYDPQSGELYFDDENYKSLDVDSLRNEIAIVYQHFQSFAFSIGENVLTRELKGNEDEHDVWEALKGSGLYSKIDNLPDKLHTPLTNEFEENGTNLSGGESQKLAISKAIHKDAGVIIMDEPSSSLDPLSEHEMYLRMFNMCKDKTLILISHRLYSTKMVDKIYYMENGSIVESGSHEELIKLNGKYASLYNIQAEQYRKGHFNSSESERSMIINREYVKSMKNNSKLPFPYLVQLEITNVCPFNCPQCYKETTQICHMDFDKLKDLVTHCYDNGTSFFVLNGGEPMLYDKINELLAFMNTMDIRMNCFTSGYGMTDDIIDLWNFDSHKL